MIRSVEKPVIDKIVMKPDFSLQIGLEHKQIIMVQQNNDSQQWMKNIYLNKNLNKSWIFVRRDWLFIVIFFFRISSYRFGIAHSLCWLYKTKNVREQYSVLMKSGKHSRRRDSCNWLIYVIKK